MARRQDVSPGDKTTLALSYALFSLLWHDKNTKASRSRSQSETFETVARRITKLEFGRYDRDFTPLALRLARIPAL